MTERTICPACSAPLAYSADDQQVRCEFCGAAFDIIREGDQARLQVASQPQPQKDELSRAAQSVAQDVEEEAAEEFDETFLGAVREAGGERVVPGFASSVAERVEPERVIPAAQQPYQVGPPAPPQPSNNRNRWVVIGVSFFAVFCLICLVLAGALAMYVRNNGGQFGF